MNPVRLDDYREVAPKGTVEFLRRLAMRVRGRRFLHVNSTRYGGGVAEILHRLVPLMAELEVDTRWEVMKGNPEFYAVTKAFHNALQGTEQTITKPMLDCYLATNVANAEGLSLEGDLVLIHDPQPAALIEHRTDKGKWVWRCHIDLSHPQRRAWRFVRRHVAKYDAAVFSLPKFAQRLSIPQFLVYPSIDPLSDKNRDLSEGELNGTLERLGIPRDKPILLQVSRFDRFKDPIGVINSYRLVKRHKDCPLILAAAWIIAYVLRILATRGLQVMRFDERVAASGLVPSPREGEAPRTLASQVGNAVFYLTPSVLPSGLPGGIEPHRPGRPVRGVADEAAADPPGAFGRCGDGPRRVGGGPNRSTDRREWEPLLDSTRQPSVSACRR